MNTKAWLIKIIANIKDYLLLLISLIIIFGAIIYYIDAFYSYDLLIVLILTSVTFLVLNKYLFKNKKNQDKLKFNWLILNNNYQYLIVYGLIFAFLLISLYFAQSDRPLISPWQVIKPSFFIGYAFASLVLILSAASKNLGTQTKLFIISLHYFITLIIAVIIYKIGYGFDPFIHQATMELIDKKGIVMPKPPYYLGQYSLIIIFHKLSGLSIYLLNKLLVPISAALFLPPTIDHFLTSFFINQSDTGSEQNNRARFLTLIFLLILTVTPFIATTPQNFSYLFLILVVLNGLSRKNLIWVIVLALATTAIHPLTGLPALGWVAWLSLKKYQNRVKPLTAKLIKIIIAVCSTLILPIALFLAGGANLKIINLNFSLLIDPFRKILSGLSLSGSEDWLFNFIYFFGANFNLFLILISFAALIYFYKQKNRPDWSSLLYINISLLIAYILSSQIVFNDLINYEQSSYAGRLLIIICFFNLPFIIYALEKMLIKILKQDSLVIFFWLITGVAMLSISLYISYPRYDKYFNSRGYSVSANDLTAVRLIAKNTKEPYFVLANQQVSVAALKEFGFYNYYKTINGLIYFYPIPTGGPLYQYYLDMVYKSPDQKTIQGAFNLVGVKNAYLIVNKYWNNSAKIINAAKIEADSFLNVNNEVYIFKYKAKD